MHRLLLVLFPFVHLSRAATLYIHPPTPPHIADPAAALSRHLGLDAFEPLPAFRNSAPLFLAHASNALFLTLDRADADAVMPPSFPPSFDLALPKLAFSSVIPSLVDRAQYSYASVYVGPEDVSSLSTFFAVAETPSFAALDLGRLSDLRRHHGVTSPQYIEVATQIRLFLQEGLAESDCLRLALLTYSTSSDPVVKRQPPQSPLPPPHEPLGSISTCFTSADACNNSTKSCSGRGQCVEATKSGRTCYVCVCGVTKMGEGTRVKTDVWTGESCERKDISGPFALLTGTALVLILLIFGSISLLSSITRNELPSTLLATAVNAKKD